MVKRGFANHDQDKEKPMAVRNANILAARGLLFPFKMTCVLIANTM